MIERLYIKAHFSFKECELNLQDGLIAFTGPSGAGKSVLMQAILSLFGYSEANASVIEATISNEIDMSEFGIVSDEVNVFKLMKSKSTRYFVNSQNISKKNINEISKEFLSYLSVKDNGEFENERLLEFLDAICIKNDALHVEHLKDFTSKYEEYKKLSDELKILIEKEKKVEELKDFARYEITKIEEIDPKKGEDEELMILKKSLSKKEKLETALSVASLIFDYESSVVETLNLMEKDTTFFDECMNELRSQFETQKDVLGELEDINIEVMLERIEKIAGLKKRYGSIEEVLTHKEHKIKELKEYENISFEKKDLQQRYENSKEEIKKQSNQISKTRLSNLSTMNDRINYYLSLLYMPSLALELKIKSLDEHGIDEIVVNLGKVELKKISSGEYNRLRLAFLAAREEYLRSSGGVLILDEIDSNLSGKESMSVANVLEILSKKYQIFAISHQPQLSSKAKMHFLISKNEKESKVKLLNKNERIEELARMVSGEEISAKAIEFAKSLMSGEKND